MDAIGIKASRLNDLFHFDDGDSPSGGHVGVKVARRFAKHQVTRRVGAPSLDDRKIGPEPSFSNIVFAVKCLVWLTLRDQRANARLGIKRWDPCAACANALGQRALRGEFKFDRSR